MHDPKQDARDADDAVSSPDAGQGNDATPQEPPPPPGNITLAGMTPGIGPKKDGN